MTSRVPVVTLCNKAWLEAHSIVRQSCSRLPPVTGETRVRFPDEKCYSVNIPYTVLKHVRKFCLTDLEVTNLSANEYYYYYWLTRILPSTN
jgi:hypothetical protein